MSKQKSSATLHIGVLNMKQRNAKELKQKDQISRLHKWILQIHQFGSEWTMNFNFSKKQTV